jgi:hypothetical protein
MTLGIMQPYFMPYIGYFQLINAVDIFIIFDTPQFTRHGWIERNQILKPNGETLYIKVPLKKHTQKTAIKNTEINNAQNWKEKILAQFGPYKKKAPYYHSIIALLEESWNIETNSIVELNKKSLTTICQYLGIDTPIEVWSEMKVDIAPVNASDEWALNICKALNADSYINPIGGKSFFDVTKYDKNNINISFLESIPEPYAQLSDSFVPFLSILDMLMFNSEVEVREMLKKYILE